MARTEQEKLDAKREREYEKKHKKEVTDAEVLENIAEGKEKIPVQKKSKGGIVVKGIHDVAVRFSRCCNPVPGDEIVGFVTRGRGVSVHRTDCINIINLSDMERERLIDAEWQHDEASGGNGLYQAEIKVFCNNRTGLLVDITKSFTERVYPSAFLSRRVFLLASLKATSSALWADTESVRQRRAMSPKSRFILYYFLRVTSRQLDTLRSPAWSYFLLRQG